MASASIYLHGIPRELLENSNIAISWLLRSPAERQPVEVVESLSAEVGSALFLFFTSRVTWGTLINFCPHP